MPLTCKAPAPDWPSRGGGCGASGALAAVDSERMLGNNTEGGAVLASANMAGSFHETLLSTAQQGQCGCNNLSYTREGQEEETEG